MSFSTSLAKACDEQREAILKIRKAALLDLGGSIIRDTPVLTGLLQGNWQTSVGAPREGVLNIRPMNMAIAEVVEAASALRGDETIYIRNNCAHAWRCEFGWSKKAPAGMVRKNVARVNRIVRNAKGAQI